MKVTRAITLTLLTLTLFTTAPASGSIMLDNPGTLDSGSGSSFSNTSRLNGLYFTMKGTPYTLDSAAIAIGVNSAFTTDFTMKLWQLGPTDIKPANGSTPLYFETFYSVSVPTTPALHAFTPSTEWLLAADTRYALTWQASGTGFNFQWKGTNPPAFWTGHNVVTPGSSLYSLNGGATFTSASNTNYGVELIGTAYNPSAVPEPSTYALLCISLGVVGFARRKMKKGGALSEVEG